MNVPVEAAALQLLGSVTKYGTDSPSIVKRLIWPVRAIMDARKLIGWNVRKLRVELGLSQERVAHEAEIDRSYVGRIERGEENVTISVLEAIATALRVPVGALFNEFEDGSEKPPPLPSGRKPNAK